MRRWTRVLEATGRISVLVTIICMGPMLSEVYQWGWVSGPWAEIASWSLFLSISCLMFAGRILSAKALLILAALGLLLVNGHLSEVILEPLLGSLGFSFDRDYWANNDFDMRVVLTLPIVFSAALFRESEIGAVEYPHLRRAVLLSFVWVGMCLLTTTGPFQGDAGFILVIALAAVLGLYLYRLALAQINMLKAMRQPVKSSPETSSVPLGL